MILLPPLYVVLTEYDPATSPLCQDPVVPADQTSDRPAFYYDKPSGTCMKYPQGKQGSTKNNFPGNNECLIYCGK